MQPFIEEGQPALALFPNREVATLLVAYVVVIAVCAVAFVSGLHMLRS